MNGTNKYAMYKPLLKCVMIYLCINQPAFRIYLLNAVFYEYQSRLVTGLEWPRGFQEVKVPRFHDNGTGRW